MTWTRRRKAEVNGTGGGCVPRFSEPRRQCSCICRRRRGDSLTRLRRPATSVDMAGLLRAAQSWQALDADRVIWIGQGYLNVSADIRFSSSYCSGLRVLLRHETG